MCPELNLVVLFSYVAVLLTQMVVLCVYLVELCKYMNTYKRPIASCQNVSISRRVLTRRKRRHSVCSAAVFHCKNCSLHSACSSFSYYKQKPFVLLPSPFNGWMTISHATLIMWIKWIFVEIWMPNVFAQFYFFPQYLTVGFGVSVWSVCCTSRQRWSLIYLFLCSPVLWAFNLLSCLSLLQSFGKAFCSLDKFFLLLILCDSATSCLVPWRATRHYCTLGTARSLNSPTSVHFRLRVHVFTSVTRFSGGLRGALCAWPCVARDIRTRESYLRAIVRMAILF